MIITTKTLLKICCANKTFGSYIFIDHKWLFTDWLQRNNYLSVLLTASSVKFQGKLPAWDLTLVLYCRDFLLRSRQLVHLAQG